MIKCIKNWIDFDDGDIRDLSTYLTIGKIYYFSGKKPCSEYVYNIIDDLGKSHDIYKNLFINIKLVRQEKLEQLGI